MARGINKVILVGNLGDDPEVRSTQGGMTVTTIRMATSSVRKDREGNQQERTEWHRVKFFGKLGEIAGEYLKKGRQVYVEGSIRYDEYTDKEGNKRYVTEIIGDEMQMLGGGGEGVRGERSAPRGESRGAGGGGYGGGSGGGYGGGGQRQAPAQRPAAPADNIPFDDDEIPF